MRIALVWINNASISQKSNSNRIVRFERRGIRAGGHGMRVILCVKICKVKVFFSLLKCIFQMTYFSQNNYLIVLFEMVFFLCVLQPGESGFVLLGDLTVETSTDPEPDDSWICDPPSPCDVQFKNANVVINGKSSIRDRSRNDTKVRRFYSGAFN